MKKQEPSGEYKKSRKRTSSTHNENLSFDSQIPHVGILQCCLTPPAKRIKNEHVDYGTNEPVLCTSIHVLPNEILDKIFSFLGIKQRIDIERVCKRWNWMGRQLKWQWPTSLGLFTASPLVSTYPIEAVLFRCGKYLKKLQLFNTRSCLLRRAIEIIAHYCSNLEYIFIQELRPTCLCLQTLAEGCPKLKTVCLNYLINYPERELTYFLGMCKNLECLDICGPITGKCFSLVSSKLRILRLTSQKLDTVGLKNVMNRCQHLCEFQMTTCSKRPLILKAFLMKYKETLTILALEVYWCSYLCNAFDGLQNLEVLSLVNCTQVDDELLNLLSRECHNLKDLSICNTQVTDLGLRHLASLPHLKVLDISYNIYFSDVGVRNVAMEGRLEELYARYISAQPHYFIELARFCPNLRVVDMSYNILISNVVVEAFYEGIRSGSLKGPIKLFVGNTGVSEATMPCDLLQLHYESCCRSPSNDLHNICYSARI